jgi:FHA domain
MNNMAQFCPYKGLMPYEENDENYFFGRSNEQQLISSNLFVSRLTLLYGPSGAGKSSVLRAGVLPKLRRLMEHNQKQIGSPELLVVECHEWRDDPEETLRHKLVGALAKVSKDSLDLSTTPLPEGLRLSANQIEGVVLLILDQFEEFFQYHVQDERLEGFSRLLIEILQDRSLQANILISIREDALAKLDVFKGHIPNLFSNYLRLDFLDRQGVKDAILEPLKEYKRRYPESDGMDIEPALVEELIKPFQGDNQYGTMRTGYGNNDHPKVFSEEGLETPYLQLVLTRVWEWEVNHNSHLMRLTTFHSELGGADQIVSSHIDNIVADLSISEREVAAEMFRYLVTSSGTKFAQSTIDLADYTKCNQDIICNLARKLSDANKRILRPVAPPLNKPTLERYEIFHDVLGVGVLDWSRRFRSERTEKFRWQKRIRYIAFASATVLAIISALYYNYFVLWQENRPWAYMTSLTSGKSYPLSGDQILVGRTVEGYRNTIDIQGEGNYISRFHFGVYRNFVATDMRSLNGTTINAEFLIYGQARTLQDQDIITLAGFDSFRFHPFRYEKWSYDTWFLNVPAMTDHPSTNGWGIFIDGERKKAVLLYNAVYYINKDKIGFHLAEAKSSDSLGVIKRTENALTTIMDFNDAIPLQQITKKGDHEEDYKMDILASELELGLEFPSPYQYDGLRFQVVPINKGIESGESTHPSMPTVSNGLALPR